MRLLVIEDEDRLSGILKSKLGDIGVAVERNVAGEVLGTQPEFPISQRAGGQRCAVNETAHGEATRDKEEGASSMVSRS